MTESLRKKSMWGTSGESGPTFARPLHTPCWVTTAGSKERLCTQNLRWRWMAAGTVVGATERGCDCAPLRTRLLSAVMALVSPHWARPTLGHSGYTTITREHVPRAVLLRAARCESKPFDSVWLLTTLYLRRTVLLNHHSRRVLAP